MSVNVPGLTLPRAENTLRLIYIHRNVPGVLARVNGLLAEAGVNVEAQLLSTRGEFGVVVTDSASGTTQAVVDQIRRPCPRRSACASSSDCGSRLEPCKMLLTGNTM